MPELHSPQMSFPTCARDLGLFLGAEVCGDVERKISGLASIDSAQENTLSFLADKKYAPLLQKARGATLLTTREFANPETGNTFLIVENPKLAFAKAATSFLPKIPWEGISPLAFIHPTAKIEEGAAVGPFAVISEGAVIGSGTTIFPHCYIGPGVKVGVGTEIHSHVVLVTHVVVGDRVKIFAGSVIGSEGFGYLDGEGGLVAMPQVGRVVIENDVRIGAHCTIDRSTLGETRVGQGSKLDDQVHVGHNCIIGKNCLLCAQVALGGSSILEDGVILGGQVGLAGHLTIGKGAALGGQSGTSFNIKPGERYFGSPAVPIKQAFRSMRAIEKLPDFFERLKKIEKQLEGAQ